MSVYRVTYADIKSFMRNTRVNSRRYTLTRHSGGENRRWQVLDGGRDGDREGSAIQRLRTRGRRQLAPEGQGQRRGYRED